MRTFEKRSLVFGTIKKQLRTTQNGKFHCYMIMNDTEVYTGTIDGNMEHAYALELKESGYIEV